MECLDAFSGSVILSTLDMTAGYNQIPIREKDILKTAFVSHHDLFEFCTAPFGSTNMPGTFRHVMARDRECHRNSPVSWSRRFVRNFAMIVRPLTDFTKKRV